MTLLALHAAATWFMVGLIWVVQLVHYPGFRHVASDDFVAFEEMHTRRMGQVLAVPAAAEAVTGGALLWARPDGVPLGLVLLGGALLAAAWLTTLLVQVPMHRRLAAGKDDGVIERLVETNWWRTAAWTLRGILVSSMVVAL